MLTFRLFILGGTLAAGSLFSAMAHASYTQLDLGYLTPTALNNVGQVVGYSNAAGQSGFVTGVNGIGMTSLGYLGTHATPIAINDSGTVVGTLPQTSSSFMVGPTGNASLYSGFHVVGVNASGQALGYSSATYSNHFISNIYVTGPQGQGAVFNYSDSDDYDIPVAINNFGQMVINQFGTVIISGTQAGGFANNIKQITLSNSYATAMNNKGQVLGSAEGANGYQTFLTSADSNSMIWLQATNLTANGLNDSGEVARQLQGQTACLKNMLLSPAKMVRE